MDGAPARGPRPAGRRQPLAADATAAYTASTATGAVPAPYSGLPTYASSSYAPAPGPAALRGRWHPAIRCCS
ncbi:hypothetical protein ACFQX7_26900, partial [Luedemannella flava]